MSTDFETKTIKRPPREVIYEHEPDRRTLTIIEYDADDVIKIMRALGEPLPRKSP